MQVILAHLFHAPHLHASDLLIVIAVAVAVVVVNTLYRRRK